MQRPQSEHAERTGLLVRLECQIRHQGDTYLAACHELGVFDQGETEEAARRNLQVSLTLFFQELAAQGPPERILADRGVLFTAIRADHALPEVMENPQVVTEVHVTLPPAATPSPDDEVRKVPFAAYLWTHQGQRFGAVRS